MRARTRSHRLATAGLAALLVTAAAVGAGTLTSSVSAYQPASDLSDAVTSYRNGLPADLRTGIFASTDNGPDGLAGPDGTPDHQGAFRFYGGPAGPGAVYVHRWGSSITRGAIYGDILGSWSYRGYEAGPLGYPVGLERNATYDDVSRGCRSGDRAQSFRKDLNSVIREWRACWNPGTAQVTWRYVDFGA